jgi:RNA polymerase sigma-70 factor, ECF subfamily
LRLADHLVNSGGEMRATSIERAADPATDVARGHRLELPAADGHGARNTTQIAAGRAELDRALALGGRGPYVLQAAIASLHAELPCDWAQIAALYGELARLTSSPVVELNRAIAIAETDGPEAGLRIADGLGLHDFRYLHSTRAELLRRLGRTDEARDAYRRARELTDDGAERRFLERQLTELAATTARARRRSAPGTAAGAITLAPG